MLGNTGQLPPATPRPPAAPTPPGSFAPVPGRVPNRAPGRGGRRPPPPPTRRRLINYPRHGRQGWTRWLPSWKLILGLIALGFFSMIAAVFAVYASITVPKQDQRVMAQTTTITYADGSPMAQLATQNRQNVKLSAVPPTTRNAVLAAEDRTFYTNNGVDPKSIARALWSNARGKPLQGGSTITQQYVKNIYNQRERTFKRKFTEVFLSVKINKSLDKDLILERYLNTIYLGRGAYGIQAASQAYFHEDVGDLTVSQSAFLAGIINAPSLADPRGGSDEKARAVRRWGVVLDAMVKEKWLDAGQRAGLKFPTTIVPVQQDSMKGQNGYLVTMAEAEVKRKLGYTEDQIVSGGLKIVTTFNKALIADGVRAVKQSLPKDKPKRLQIGMTAIDPKTGAVRAIYGGKDYLKRQQNAATQDSAEAGSTFKAFALLAALKDGVSLKNAYSSDTPARIKGYKVDNFGGEHFGYIDLIRATEESVNTVYVRLNAQIGADKTQAAAYAAGIPKSAHVTDTLSNVLGPANPHPIDLASAYATIASQGIRHTPFVVQSVTEVSTGKVLISPKSIDTKGVRAFPADVTADATYALQHVVTGGTGTCAQSLNRPVAAKTGTSQNSRSAWFVGFTPQLATAVSMYQPSASGHSNVAMKGFGAFSSIFGGGYPCRVWTAFMTDALNGKPIIPFPEPAWGGKVTTAKPTTRPTTQPTTEPTHSQGPTHTTAPTTPPPTSSTPTPPPTSPKPSDSGPVVKPDP